MDAQTAGIAVLVGCGLILQAAPAGQRGPDARIVLQETLDAVSAGWFGKAYQDVNAVDIKGNLALRVAPQIVNAKVGQLSQGQVSAMGNQGANLRLKVNGTYFANGDFRTELTGDFGNLLYTRVGNRGFLYSRDQNTYTTKVEPPPVDAPLTYMGWFRQVLNDIRAVYVDGTTFKTSVGKEEAIGGVKCRTVTFLASTSAYDAKKREQSLSESLGFWKKGRLEVIVDATSKLPRSLEFTNEAQGVSTRMHFHYRPDKRLEFVDMANRSRGAQGPAMMRVSYGGDGLINRVEGKLESPRQSVSFDLDLAWGRGRRSASIVSVPPPGAVKKGSEEMKTLLAVGLAGRILDLQRKGLNLRSVSLSNP